MKLRFDPLKFATDLHNGTCQAAHDAAKWDRQGAVELYRSQGYKVTRSSKVLKNRTVYFLKVNRL